MPNSKRLLFSTSRGCLVWERPSQLRLSKQSLLFASFPSRVRRWARDDAGLSSHGFRIKSTTGKIRTLLSLLPLLTSGGAQVTGVGTNNTLTAARRATRRERRAPEAVR